MLLSPLAQLLPAARWAQTLDVRGTGCAAAQVCVELVLLHPSRAPAVLQQHVEPAAPHVEPAVPPLARPAVARPRPAAASCVAAPQDYATAGELNTFGLLWRGMRPRILYFTLTLSHLHCPVGQLRSRVVGPEYVGHSLEA